MPSKNFNHQNRGDAEHNAPFDENGNNQNIYKKQYAKDHLTDLEQDAPYLANPVERGINKKAIAFLGVAGLGLVGLGAFAYQQLQGDEQQPQERAEVVTVPSPPPLPNPVASNTPPSPNERPSSQETVGQNTQAIEVVQPSSPAGEPAFIQQPQTVPVQQATSTNGEAGGMSLDEMRRAASPLVEGENSAAASGSNVATGTVRHLQNRDKLLVRGTYLRCVLETKIVSDVPGFTSCIITEPVYSVNGQYLLIPKGSKAMGQYGSSNPTGPRLAVIWDRIITPTGLDISLQASGVDNLGAAGHYGKFQSHWPQRFASALLISMMSDAFKYAAAEYGPDGNTVTTSTSTVTNPYESETADTLRELTRNQLERNSARPNTVTINQGSLINIYAAQDVDFSAVLQ